MRFWDGGAEQGSVVSGMQDAADRCGTTQWTGQGQLEALLAVPGHQVVEVTWKVYQRIVAAYGLLRHARAMSG